ncbi:hypothetical protein B0H10DRAFT_1790355 [Mycena sp. CBHHK59/15]|nr:hypothetical protein B0H10DRAFT_1790355 [Mycena sp. CBHHK59/15]
MQAPQVDPFLRRHGTLLSNGATPVRRAAELKSLLGNANSRLRPGAVISQHPQGRELTSLEQAKPRARVEIDIVLHSNVCVEGGYMRGHIKLRIRPRAKKESSVMISDGKLRIIGFESTETDHHEFFHSSAALSKVALSSPRIYASPPDPEGFCIAREGVHKLEFEMHIPFGGDTRPKGPLYGQSGAAVRYIALVSIKVKDDSNRRSIAHFYRDCEVWPRLNPSVILAPAEQPIQATTIESLFMGGNGKVKLTATLHRLHFVAGQQCPVHVSVQNDTKKAIKSLTLTLFRSTVVFKRHSRLDPFPGTLDQDIADPDACQTSTTGKIVASSTLEMAQGFSRGHASTGGWWPGIASGERSNFSHLLLIPVWIKSVDGIHYSKPNALTHSREKLIEVEYTIRVSLNALLTSDLYVTLPIRVINFLSLDPPPTSPYPHYQQPAASNLDRSRTIVQEQLGNDAEADVPPSEIDDDCISEPSSDLVDELNDQEGYQDTSHAYTDEESQYEAELADLSMCEDAEDLVQHAIVSAQMHCPEDATRASMNADLGQATARRLTNHGEEELLDASEASSYVHVDMQPSPTNTNTARPNRPRGPSSFAMRVQEKLQVAASAWQPIASEVKIHDQVFPEEVPPERIPELGAIDPF